MDKKELRDYIRKFKRAMTKEEIEAKSEKLAELFLASDLYKQAKNIYGYLPYNQEVRTVPMLEQAMKDGKRVAVPKCYGDEMRFLFMDDLSFEEFEIEYKYLKAVIEGGLETRPENVLIYATSNRRNLIRETWNDRQDMEHHGDIHRSDTVEEKMSLSARFGVSINFNTPTQKEYHQIVLALAERQGITMDRKELLSKANTWQIRHRSFSGRTAQQFIYYLQGQTEA